MNIPLKDVIGRQIRTFRSDLGLYQEEIAKLSQISTRQYQAIEAGDNLPTLETLFKIACALRVSVFDIINPAWESHLEAYSAENDYPDDDFA